MPIEKSALRKLNDALPKNWKTGHVISLYKRLTKRFLWFQWETWPQAGWLESGADGAIYGAVVYDLADAEELSRTGLFSKITLGREP